MTPGQTLRPTFGVGSAARRWSGGAPDPAVDRTGRRPRSSGGRSDHVRSPPRRLRTGGLRHRRARGRCCWLHCASCRRRWGERSIAGRRAGSPAPSAAWSGRQFSCSACCPCTPWPPRPIRRRRSWPPPTSRRGRPPSRCRASSRSPRSRRPSRSRPTPQPAHEPAPGSASAYTVAVGDSFWSIAEQQVTSRLGRTPTDADVLEPWLALIDVNRDRLLDPADPDLLHPGQVLRLPAP